MIITENAKNRIKTMLSDPGNEHFSLRIGVQGGKCSGLTHTMNLDIPTSDDEVIVLGDNHRVVIDPISYKYLEKTNVDYIDSLQNSGFSFESPSYTRQCGCGQSFNVE